MSMQVEPGDPNGCEVCGRTPAVAFLCDDPACLREVNRRDRLIEMASDHLD